VDYFKALFQIQPGGNTGHQTQVNTHTTTYSIFANVRPNALMLTQFCWYLFVARSSDSLFSTVTRLLGWKPGLDSRQGQGFLLIVAASRPALWPTQPPNQWVSGVLFLGISGRRVKLTTHIHIVPRLRTRGTITLFPHTPSRRILTAAALSTVKPVSFNEHWVLLIE